MNQIAHKTIGSGDIEPSTIKMNVLPHVYEQIVDNGRRIIDTPHRKKIKEGDTLVLREWVMVLETPACYHHVAGYSGRESKALVIEVLPPRHKGYTTALIRLVNEKSLYERARSFLSRTLRSLTFPRRGRKVS
jgi:hypothetical protein